MRVTRLRVLMKNGKYLLSGLWRSVLLWEEDCASRPPVESPAQGSESRKGTGPRARVHQCFKDVFFSPKVLSSYIWLEYWNWVIGVKMLRKWQDFILFFFLTNTSTIYIQASSSFLLIFTSSIPIAYFICTLDDIHRLPSKAFFFYRIPQSFLKTRS